MLTSNKQSTKEALSLTAQPTLGLTADEARAIDRGPESATGGTKVLNQAGIFYVAWS